MTLCSVCTNECRLTDGAEVYPHRSDLHEKRFYVCDPCGARVGCHPGSTRALGTAADAETRNARSATHRLLDPLWKGKSVVSRSDVYAWLADRLGIDPKDCHVGMFSAWQCYEANRFLRETNKARRTKLKLGIGGRDGEFRRARTHTPRLHAKMR